MIESLSYFISDSTNPYFNLSVEEYLLDTVQPRQIILYLWQNERTVVIGKNQNAWKECRFQELEADGGYLARRLSGGGAVFHDLGNLNFTFLVPTAEYDLDRQMSVILKAVQNLGIHAEKTGRNDITVDGKKFSGNAFCRKGENSYHHGTLMLRVDKEQVAKYLNVSEKKLRSKGVASVSSRVCNLCDFVPELTPELMKNQLLRAFCEEYGFTPLPISKDELDCKRVMALYSRYFSWEWKFGRKIAFTWENQERFDWGEIQIQLAVNEGLIRDAVLYSDALDADFIALVSSLLVGCRMEPSAVAERLFKLETNSLQKQILSDIVSLTCQAEER